MKNLLYIIVSFFGLVAVAQHEYQPIRLSDSINTKEYAELNPVLTQDGNTLYFERLNHPDNTYGTDGSQDIWYSQKNDDGTWTAAKRLPDEINSARYNAVFGVFNNGTTLLINGVFNKRGRWLKRGLSQTHLINGDWTTPSKVKVKGLFKRNRGLAFDAYNTPDRKLLFTSFSKTWKGNYNNLYVSTKQLGEDKWSKPKKMKDVSKRFKKEQAPFLSATGDTLYFSTNHTYDTGLKNKSRKDFNIYYSVRQDNEYRKWSDPKHLDIGINTDGYETDFITDATGEIAYYVSDKEGSLDLYSIRLYEKEPYVSFKGVVMNMFKNAPVEDTSSYSIVVRKKVIASPTDYEKGVDKITEQEVFTIDNVAKDSLSGFEFHLPFGGVYEVSVETEMYNTSPVIVDTYHDKEHRVVEQNLNVKPLDYAIFKGVVIDKENNLAIAKELVEKVFISVNGLRYDSAQVQENGSFEFKLSLGDKFRIQANLEGYDSFEETVDLSAQTGFSTVNKQLYVKKKEEQFAFIKGEIFKKEGGAFDKEYTLSINGVVHKDFIEKSPNQFLIKLPLDQKHDLKLEAEDHIALYDSLNFVGQKDKIEINKKFYLTEIKIGAHVKIDNIQFAFGKSTLKPSSYASLDQVVKLLNETPSLKIEIGGHTDSKGSAKANKRLSRQRAKAVVDYLIEKGVDKERVSFKGYGMDNPVESNDTEAGRQANRRVEFTILSK
ncbi:MAG: OmpA family protein [Cytophagales bacterium]|nr:OmpA family protein [Cytophagales bacterium]